MPPREGPMHTVSFITNTKSCQRIVRSLGSRPSRGERAGVKMDPQSILGDAASSLAGWGNQAAGGR